MLKWLSDDPDADVGELELIREKLLEKWKICRFSGEGWRTDYALLKLMLLGSKRVYYSRQNNKPAALSEWEWFE